MQELKISDFLNFEICPFTDLIVAIFQLKPDHPKKG